MALRRRLRSFAVAWLAWQLTMLAAIIPVDCCAGHRMRESHRGSHAAVEQCPMRSQTGRPCSMHQHRHQASMPVEHADHTGHTGPAPSECRLNGMCGGPMAALLALISNVAVLPERAIVAHLEVWDDVPIAKEQIVRRLDPPDTPPPRA